MLRRAQSNGLSLLATPGSWFDAGSGVLLAALRLFILSVRPRRRVNVALALYGLSDHDAQRVEGEVEAAQGAGA